MNNKEFNEMIRCADRKYHFSELEKKKIRGSLEYCHATDVRWTSREMFEVYFRCDAMPGKEITTIDCNNRCAKAGCSNYTVAEDAELLINQEKNIFDFDYTDEVFFENEIKSIIKKFHGKKHGKITGYECEQLLKELERELQLLNHCVGN